MFPIPWNKAYRDKDGSIKNISDMGGGGGGSSLPPYSAADAGKVLGVTSEGTLAWVEVSGGARFVNTNTDVVPTVFPNVIVTEVTT